MNISDLLVESGIQLDLRAKDKKSAIEELVALLGRVAPLTDSKSVLQAVQDREEIVSTGIGQGIGIPHAKTSMVDSIRIVFARSTAGVEFDALDGKPVHLFFLLVAPLDRSGPHVQTLARIARLLKDASFREALLAAKGAAEIQALIREEEARRF